MKQITWIAAALAALPATAAQKSNSAPKKAPNLLFVFSDQQSYDMVGCYGNTQIITPNLDGLASRGVRMENCYVNCPLSTPFRGMLMTGQHNLYNGCFTNDVPLLPASGKKFGEVLRDAGYRTAYIGKWHLSGIQRSLPIPPGELRYGFDEVFYTNNCHMNYNKGACFYFDDNGEKVFFDDWEVFGQTQQALDYLESMRNSENPFALFVSWHPPHDWEYEDEGGDKHYIYDAPEELMAYYDRSKIKLRPDLEPTPELLRAYHGYMAMVTGVDIAMGRLLDKLKEIGADENTLIVFTSDHGDMLYSFGITSVKQHPQDYSSRVPLILSMPGKIAAGGVSPMLICTLDLMPTALGLMGLEIPASCQGMDLSLPLSGGKGKVREAIPLWLFGTPNEADYRGVVTHDYLYATSKSTGQHLKNVLFDRKKDPYQLHNLYYDPQYASIRAKLDAQTRQLMEQYGDQGWAWEDFRSRMPKGGWRRDRELLIDLMR